MQAMSKVPQSPKLLPKQFCYELVSDSFSVGIHPSYSALGDRTKEVLRNGSGAKGNNGGDDRETHLEFTG
jgi:hypothetical protein